MKVHYKSLPAVVALVALFVVATVPASAQDTGNAGFWNTMAVANGGGTLGGSSPAINGVTFYGDIQNGGTGSMWQNGYLKANVTTSAASGFLYVMWDEPGTNAAFSNMTTVAIGATSTNISIPAPASQVAGSIWVRFVYSNAAGFLLSDTDQSGGHTGEIEDYQVTIVGTGVQAIAVAESGGVTTTIDRNGADVEVTSNGISIFQGPRGNGGGLRVEGDNAADDAFVLDMTAGSPFPGGGITVDGNGQAVSDGLTVNDGAGLHATVTHNFVNASSGSVTSNYGTINYEGLEPVADNLDATSRVFTFNANAETIVLDDDAGVGNDLGTIDSDFGEIVTFDISSTTSITINAAGGNDDITVREVDSNYAGTITVNGDGENDELIVDFNSGDPIPTAGIGITFNGGAGTDFVRLSDAGLTNQTTITHNSIDSDEATVVVGALGTIDINGVEDATRDELRSTTRIFNGTAGADGNALLGDGSGADFGEFDSDETPSVEFNVTDTENIVVNLGGGNDTITVEQIDAGWGGDAADNIVINGDGGDDKMIVNFDNPLRDPIPFTGTGITFNGGVGGTDSVQFDGTTLFDSVVHTGTTTSAGSSTFTANPATLLGTVAYTGIEGNTVDNMTMATAREFTLTAAGDIVTLDDNGTDGDNTARYQSNTQPTVVFDISGTTSVTVTGGAGDDTVNLEQLDSGYTGSIAANPAGGSDALTLTFNPGDDPIPAGGMSFDGGSTGSDVDTITFLGSENQTNVIYVDTAIDGGTITNDNGTLTYSEVEGGITDSTPATERTFDFSQAGASTLEFDDAGGAANTTDQMVSNVGQNVTYRSPATTLDVDAGSGANVIIVNDLDNNFTGTVEIDGEGDDDRLDLDWEENDDSPLGGITTLTYEGGAHTTGDILRFIERAGADPESVVHDVNTVVHTYATASSGTVSVDGNGMSYAGIEPIYDFLDAVSRTFTFPDTDGGGVDDIIFLDVDNYVSAHDGALNNFIGTSGSTFGASNTSEETHFHSTATLNSITINGGGGDDYFDLEPSTLTPIIANGQAPTTFTPGDQITLNVGGLPADEKITLTESSNTAGTYSFAKQGGGASTYEDLSYTTMELVTLRYSDPNAYSGSTFEGDWTYPVNTESGISIEPYFNWDIEVNQALPALHPSKYTSLRLDVSLNSDLSSPVFQTTTKEDGVTLLIASAANEDHYIMDGDRTNPVLALNTVDEPLLMNDTQYYWGLTSTMPGGQVFCQVSRFTTIDNLIPTLDYPSEDLTIYDLDFQFDWNVASPVQPDVYWRMELDNSTAAAFVGDVPGSAQGLLMGEDENDNDQTVADGFAADSYFESTDLPTPLVWGTDYAWRVTTMWPVPPTGWVPQEIHDKDETDRLVNVSSVGEFKTVTKAFVPTLTYPDDNLTIYTNQPVLSWNVAAPFAALTFEIEIRVKGGALVCSSPIAGVSGLNYDTANCAPNLVPGTTYEWRVRSSDGTSTSAFSDWDEFTIQGSGVASAAFPSYPVDDLEIYTTSPEFHWYMAKDPTGLTWVAHYLERGGAAPASCAALKASGGVVVAPAAGSVSVTHVDVSGLKPGATYDWCVTTTGSNGSVESGLASFSVAGGTTDGAPTATWPIGNPTTYTLDQELHWSVVGAALGISGYTVEYCVNAAFGSGGPACTTVAGITEMQYEITGLDYGDVVLWRVKASYINGAADSAWSDGSFTVTGALNTLSAVLTYPVNGLIIYSDNVQLNWYVNGATLPQGTLTFEVQWSYAESFPTIGTITQTATTTDPFYDVTNLIPGHTYWWRVRISLDGGSTYGGWSSPLGQFEVTPGASAPMPRLGSPTQAIAVTTASPTLSWFVIEPSTSDVVYELYVSENSDLSNAQVYGDLTANRLQLSNLVDGQYYWAVRSISSNGTVSAFSSIETFTTNSLLSTGVEVEVDTTGGTDTVDPVDPTDTMDPTDDAQDDASDDDTGIEEEDATDDQVEIEDPTEQILPDAFELRQNYPNPFNPTTTIEFSMRQSAGVSVRIYNVLGQVVKTLVDGTLPAGIHRVQWDATDDSGTAVTSGLYLYRMETEGFASTKTLVLMK